MDGSVRHTNRGNVDSGLWIPYDHRSAGVGPCFVWGYALRWVLLSDRLKLLAYRILDPVKNKPKSETKTSFDLKPLMSKRAYELYEQEVEKMVKQIRTGIRRSRKFEKMNLQRNLKKEIKMNKSLFSI